MNSMPWPIIRYERVSQLCGLLIGVISAAALAGWFIGHTTLKGVHAAFIPMALTPRYCLSSWARHWRLFKGKSRKFLSLARGAAVITAVLAATRPKRIPDRPGNESRSLVFRFPSENLGAAPVGKMALVTAITFLLLSTGLVSAYRRPATMDERRRESLVVGVSFIGLTFCLGYFYGAPLMYGGQSIPMALNTAICFLISGAGFLIRVRFANAHRAPRGERSVGGRPMTNWKLELGKGPTNCTPKSSFSARL